MKRMRVVSRNISFNGKNSDRRVGNTFTKVLFLDVSPEIYARVKTQAKERNISMRLWVTRVIIKGLNEEYKVY